MMTIVVRAFFPNGKYDTRINSGIKDPGYKMLVPLYIFVIAMVVLGLNSSYLMDFFVKIAG